ncbi:2-oxoglutarate dehydrogenase E2 component [Sulfuritortus calidifontis]|uniref:Dihydrolipoyllysine-residue succinyltransferase n=1 Tax=Sulfuritortus calidifontis TaxID=1914471 RepID=A0A4R3JVB7_9PROT|nr:dihydrolipoyllysine-residue succinyltransferase [Sulfuritortus calidifontis]TCS70544.1 2-oxoglutarate dehydrogenase E2 component [Sulfuritortus calidifontis]
MRVEIKAPELSESVQTGTLLAWRKQAGEAVRRDETIADLETDKVILEISAPASGVLAELRVAEEAEVRAGQVLAILETDEAVASPGPVATPSEAAPIAPPPAPEPEPAAPAPASAEPAVQPARPPECPPCPPCTTGERAERRVPMSRLRQRIAERLKQAQQTAALLTTFNEINMQPVQELRGRYKARFEQERGVKLGLMSFFVKATCQALKQFPALNAYVDGHEIVHHDYYDIGVAVSSERGLVVPVLRDADRMSFAEIEQAIADFARRANSLELALEELEGGTFTISNGGVFGSLLSTPIVNPPQSGVLGLHRIQDRPVAENGQVVIRPMMYVALTYDHRIVDGREAVSFLKAIKDDLEDPARLLLEL